ncbi:MAG TPA: tRNA (guanosine(37)-N1)-methyltransferase TrmD [Acidimicrobiia bacterium]|nr:tRNA (guanosine(37)-N1)-methyltransferase TrmD [Acidimicrobiia bacterium]
MSFEIDVFTIFPDYIEGPASLALLGKAQESGLVSISTHNIRDYSKDAHGKVDDNPYGGGAGMVMTVQPIFDAVQSVQPKRPLIVLSASGKKFDQDKAIELSQTDGFSLICGRYEGIDERVADNLADEEICVGDFVLAGGESGALIIIEAVTRLISGVMGNDESHVNESFSKENMDGLLEGPQYSRPSDFQGYEVPEVLLSGDHGEIEKWRATQSIEKTQRNRPDLL